MSPVPTDIDIERYRHIAGGFFIIALFLIFVVIWIELSFPYRDGQ